MNKILLVDVTFKLLKEKVQNLGCCDSFTIRLNKSHLFNRIERQINIDLTGMMIFIKNLIILIFCLSCILISYSLYFGEVGVFVCIVKLFIYSVVLFWLLSLEALVFDLLKIELKYLLLNCISITPPSNLQAIISLISNPSKIS